MPFTPLEQSDEAPRRGFTPLAESQSKRGFTPLQNEPEQPSMARLLALNNPVTAAAEAGANLASQAVALPVAGLAGLATEAGNALGLTQKKGADVVHAVGDALTYQPRGEMGKAAAGLVAYPFEKLAEAGQAVGGKVLDTTGSPLLATAADTAINALPMVIDPAIRARKAKAGGVEAVPAEVTRPEVAQNGRNFVAPDDVQTQAPFNRQPEQRGFVPLDDAPPAVMEKAGGANDGSATASHQRINEIAPDAVSVDPVRQGFTPLKEVGDGIVQNAQDRVSSVVSAQNEMPAERLANQPGHAEFQPVRGVDGDAASNKNVIADDGNQGRIYSGERSLGKSEGGIAADALPSGVQRMAEHESALLQPEAQAMGSIRRGGDSSLPGMAEQFRDIPKGRRAEAQPEAPAITQGFNQELLPGERGLGDAGFVGRPEESFASRNVSGGREAGVEAGEGYRGEAISAADHARSGTDNPRTIAQQAHVIDPNAGPLSRLAAIAAPELVKRAEPVRGFMPLETSSAVAGNVKAMHQPSRGFTPLADSQTQAMAGKVQNSWAPGANYAPLIDDATSPAGAKSVANLPDPIRRENIIKDFSRALDSTVYEGRVKGKNRLGFFRPGVEEVRTKRFNDLEVAGHELAHLIDHRAPELSQVIRADKALTNEFKSVSYDQRNLAEGFAEGMRLWLTQPETLQARAPGAAAFLDQFAAKHAYGPALKKAQADMTAWFGQDALNRARSKIGTDKPLSEHFDRAFDKFRQSTVDDLHGVYQMERDMTGGKITPNGPYESARLSRASASIADGAIQYGHPLKKADGSFTYAGKGLEEILRPVAGSLDDTLLYFVGRSARELMMQGREHLFTKAEIKGMLDLHTPERLEAFKEYQKWNKGILDFAEAQGVLNPETRKQWKRMEYLPFHRVQQPGGMKGKPGDWAGVKALTGGTDNIRDVLGNMVANAAQLIDVAVKNEARLKIAELAGRPGGGKFMVKIDPESRPVKVSGSQVMDEMFKRYGIAIDGQPPAFFEFFMNGMPPAGSNVVAVLKDGKKVWYEVGDPILLRSLQSIDRLPMHWLTQWLGFPKRLGQLSITLTPDFMVGNIARDTIMGAVMSRSGFRPVVDSINGMRLRMTNDPLYKDFIANGGGLSSIYLDQHHFRTKLEKFYGKQGIDYRTVMDTPDKILSAVETIADAFEVSTRMGEYKRAIDAGEHPRHAAYLGREVSTDFAMKGDSKALGFMYDTVMFLRPAVASMDRLYRGVAHDPNKAAIGAKTAMLALASVGLYLLNRDNPKYQDMEDWKKDAHWHFFVPGPGGSEQHFMYPKIWEVGAVASLAERTTAKLLQDNPDGLGKDFARILGNTFNLNFMPQIVAPLAEQATNRNSFTKAPIETPGMENVQPFLRAKPNTSETMKALGMATRDLPESLQVPPARAEALLRGYLNTWAMYGLMLSDKAFFNDVGPAMRADEMPVVRRFYANEPAKHTKFESQFYDMLGEAKRLQGTMRELDRMGRPEIADEKERSPLAGEAKPLERAQQNIRAINAELMATHRNKDLTPEQKRQRVDELIIEKNVLLKATVQDAKAAQKR